MGPPVPPPKASPTFYPPKGPRRDLVAFARYPAFHIPWTAWNDAGTTILQIGEELTAIVATKRHNNRPLRGCGGARSTHHAHHVTSKKKFPDFCGIRFGSTTRFLCPMTTRNNPHPVTRPVRPTEPG